MKPKTSSAPYWTSVVFACQSGGSENCLSRSLNKSCPTVAFCGSSGSNGFIASMWSCQNVAHESRSVSPLFLILCFAILYLSRNHIPTVNDLYILASWNSQPVLFLLISYSKTATSTKSVRGPMPNLPGLVEYLGG